MDKFALSILAVGIGGMIWLASMDKESKALEQVSIALIGAAAGMAVPRGGSKG